MEDACDSVTGCVLTGAWIWDSAMVLSHWMSKQAELEYYDFNGKTVLELGAGTGLPGLTAAKLGAARVILTDIEQLIPALEKSVEVNCLGDRVEVCEHVWGSELPVRICELKQVDLVILSDLFFDAADMAALAKTLKKVCGKETTVWAASEVRPWTSDCLHELVREGFDIVELSNQVTDVSPEDVTGVAGERDTFSVFHLYRSYLDRVRLHVRKNQKVWAIPPAKLYKTIMVVADIVPCCTFS
ncbi:hypothetical protein M9H77_33020 [Catharanthus roseus]|uniref:Uncharacterized protein n=1 Tax=Catharanthus roseus TaxID=4058 RepID=A0ACC0A746_CATRO|nr:hypothetical protein M9H77_33020 [Catharanthus roseus]